MDYIQRKNLDVTDSVLYWIPSSVGNAIIDTAEVRHDLRWSFMFDMQIWRVVSLLPAWLVVWVLTFVNHPLVMCWSASGLRCWTDDSFPLGTWTRAVSAKPNLTVRSTNRYRKLTRFTDVDSMLVCFSEQRCEYLITLLHVLPLFFLLQIQSNFPGLKRIVFSVLNSFFPSFLGGSRFLNSGCCFIA